MVRCSNNGMTEPTTRRWATNPAALPLGIARGVNFDELLYSVVRLSGLLKRASRCSVSDQQFQHEQTDWHHDDLPPGVDVVRCQDDGSGAEGRDGASKEDVVSGLAP